MPEQPAAIGSSIVSISSTPSIGAPRLREKGGCHSLLYTSQAQEFSETTPPPNANMQYEFAEVC